MVKMWNFFLVQTAGHYHYNVPVHHYKCSIVRVIKYLRLECNIKGHYYTITITLELWKRSHHYSWFKRALTKHETLKRKPWGIEIMIGATGSRTMHASTQPEIGKQQISNGRWSRRRLQFRLLFLLAILISEKQQRQHPDDAAQRYADGTTLEFTIGLHIKTESQYMN